VQQITYRMDLKAPIEKAFDLVDDPEKLKLWMDGLVETRYLSEPDPHNPVGAKFKQKIKEGGRIVEYDGEVTAYQKPKHLAVRIGNKHFAVDVDYRFTPTADGTRLDYACSMHNPGLLARVMGFLFGWLTRRILRKHMTKFKELAEQTPA
jgi:uncharacterized protein YndB with AHSA1/START domain